MIPLLTIGSNGLARSAERQCDPDTELTYSKAGVDVRKIRRLQLDIDEILADTFATRRGKFGQVLNLRQHYAGLIDIGKDLALALHVDGVGTKVLVAHRLGEYRTVGIDLSLIHI